MKSSGGGGSGPLPPPRPKSPPKYPDLYGKRRGLINVQMLEREIGFLEEELKSVEDLHPASRACKEISDYVSGKTEDPFIPLTGKSPSSYSLSCGIWKWLCNTSCFNLSRIWCCGCYPVVEMPQCQDCKLCNCNPCSSCLTLPKCQFCSCSDIQCFNKCSGNQFCCICKSFCCCKFIKRCSEINTCKCRTKNHCSCC